MKKTFFLFLSILFFCYSILPSLGSARTASSIDDQIYYSEESAMEIESMAEEEPETESEPKSQEASEEDRTQYDSQPETTEEVQEWIDTYLDADNDPKEKPNWEKEVKEDLMPEGWKCEFVEGGDEYFEADYYTIALDYDPQPEEIEEVRELIENYVYYDLDENKRPNWEEEVEEEIIPNGWGIEFVEGGDETFEADYYTISTNYDSQPEKIEEVREWIKSYLDSDKDPSKKPHWEKEVEEKMIPNGWEIEFVEGGDEHFEADYYSISLKYDAQPTTIEEVREWIKNYLESDKDSSEKPHWEKEVDDELIPNGWEVEFVENGDENFEAGYYTINLVYDPQPKTIEETQEWIDNYVDSENDPSEKPNWEEDVKGELMPEGWETGFVEGGDETFEASYFTIFQLEGEEEEVVEGEEESEEEVEGEELEEETFEYDKQPTTKEEVQEWVDKFVKSRFDPNAKPHWEFNVDKNLMPKGWKTDFVAGGDEYFGLSYYSIFAGVAASADIIRTVTNETEFGTAISDINNNTGGIHTITITNNFSLGNVYKITGLNDVTITSSGGSTITASSSRHFEIENGAKVTLANITLDGGDTRGGIDVLDGGSLVMNDGAIIQNCYAALGGGILLHGAGSFEGAEDAKKAENPSPSSTFIMNGGQIIDNTSGGGGGVLARFNSKFVMTGGTISGNDADAANPVAAYAYAGGVGVEFSTFEMSAGEISNNTAGFAGGGVTLGYGSEFTLKGDGKIFDNTTQQFGGGVVIGDRTLEVATINADYKKTSTFIMEGGAIYENHATKEGGGVIITSSVFEMSGGEISDNKTENAGGGVWVGAYLDGGDPSEFIMSGNSKIINNTTKVGTPDPSQQAHDYFSVGGGVMVDDGSTFRMKKSTGGDAPEISYNSSYHHGGGVHVQGVSKFYLEEGKISRNTSSYSGGGVYVGYQNFVVGNDPATMDDSEFYMSGGTIEWNETTFDPAVNRRFLYGGGVHVDKGHFKMSGGNILNNISGFCGGGVSIASGNFNMTGGTISGNNTDSTSIEDRYHEVQTNGELDEESLYTYGGGVWVGRSYYRNDPDNVPLSTFDMSGGTIGGTALHSGKSNDNNTGRGNYATESGGGVYISRGVTFEMYGSAKITFNHTEKRGGGVYTSHGSDWSGSYSSPGSKPATRVASTFNLGKGTDGDAPIISDNEANLAGGGVYAGTGTRFNMRSGAITKNSTKDRGGGVALLQCYFNMSGGEISNNTSVDRGGALTNVYSIFEMTGGEITGNKTNNESGGVYVGGHTGSASDFKLNHDYTPKELTDQNNPNYKGAPHYFLLAGDAEISKNTAKMSGGGVGIDSGSLFEMSGGKVTLNKTEKAGGGVAVRESSTFNMSNGLIENNTSNLTGGGVYVVDTQHGVSDDKGEINPSVFNMSGGTIKGNDASFGTQLSEEEAAKLGVEDLANGGGVAIVRSIFNMNGDKNGIFSDTNKPFEKTAGNPRITENDATDIGGGVFANDNSIVYMYGDAEISRNETKTWDGGILIHWESKFYMHGGNIINNTSVYNGGGVGIISSDFEMSGGLIAANRTTYPQEDGAATGGGVMVGRSDIRGDFDIPGTFKMSGGTITGNHAIDSGGGVSIEDGSEFTMSGGTIGGAIPESVPAGFTSLTYTNNDGIVTPITSGNHTNVYAGGVAIQQSTFTMTDGDIIDNISYKNGGGVGLGSSVFKMTGGTISGNETIWDEYDTNNFLIDGAGAGGVWVAKLTTYDVMSTNKDPKLVPPSEVKNGESYFYMSGDSEISANKAKASGGGVSVEDSSLFDMSDGTISSNITEDAGAGVNVQNSSTFNMSDGIIKENKSQFTGAGIYVIDTNRYEDKAAAHGKQPPTTKPSTFNMSGGTIESNETTSTRGISDQDEASRLGVGNLANGGGVALVRSVFNFNGNATGKFSSTNGPFTNGAGEPTISNNTAKHIGGGVFADDYSKVYMYEGATIDRNETETWDGGILVHWKSEFHMYGGNITNNTSKFNGGGVGIISSEFYMYEGNIKGNMTTSPTDSTGGGVMIGGSDIVEDGLEPENLSYWEMRGGTISGNSAVNSGGGVSIEDGSKFEMAGGLIGRKSATDADNTANRTNDRAGGVNVQDGSLFNMRGGTVGYNSANASGGGVYLSEKSIFNLYADATITNNTTNERAGGVGIEQSYFNMYGGNIMANTSLLQGGGVSVANGMFKMTGGTISGNKTTQEADKNNPTAPSGQGGGVYVGTIDGLNPTSNPSELPLLGSQEYPEKKAISYFLMEGGKINGNTSAGFGGGVANAVGALFETKSSEINGNTCSSKSGGGVVNFGTFIMRSGEIRNNTNTGYQGGGVCNYAQFTMHDGIISGNKSTSNNGGGVSTYGRNPGAKEVDDNPGYEAVYGSEEPVFIMKGGKISSNTALFGGGVYVRDASHFKMMGGIIGGETSEANTATNNGGGVYVYSLGSKFTMDGGTISGNRIGAASSTSHGGGGVFVYGEFTMNGGVIRNNSSSVRGGGVYVHTGVDPLYHPNAGYFKMVDGEIRENTAAEGAGVYVRGEASSAKMGTFEMIGGVISGNIATTNLSNPTDVRDQRGGNGGGVYAMKYSVVNILKNGDDSPKIINNTACGKDDGKGNWIGGNGGGMYIEVDTSNPLYEQLTTADTTVFNGNTADTLMTPPVEAYTRYPKIKAGSISVPGVFKNLAPITDSEADKNKYHPLNNYDINWIGEEIKKPYTVNVQSDDHGNAWGSKDNGTSRYEFMEVSDTELDKGSVKDILLEATPNDGYRFKEWQVILGLSSNGIVNKTNSNTTFAMPRNHVTVKAIFEKIYFQFTKVDAKDNSKQLQGAEFQLYYTKDGTNYYYSVDTKGAIKWLTEDNTNFDDTIITGDGSSTFTFEQLERDKTYRLVETKAPTGYQLPAGYWEVKVDAEDKVTISDFIGESGPTTTSKVTDASGNVTCRLGNVKKVDFQFTKVDAADSTIKLLGAEFHLSNSAGKYYQLDATTGSVTWGDNEQDATVITSDATGKVNFPGLAAGTYTLVEVKAPTGYQLPSGSWTIVVNPAATGSGIFTISATSGHNQQPAFEHLGLDALGNPIYQVGNIKNFELPLTGNEGFYWLIALGLLLMVAGTTRVIYNRRKKNQDSTS